MAGNFFKDRPSRRQLNLTFRKMAARINAGQLKSEMNRPAAENVKAGTKNWKVTADDNPP
jgi:hypothetical protein